MESMNMTQQDFSKFLGQSTATMSSVFNGRTTPSMRLVEAIKKHMPEVSYDWLLDGVGPMYVDKSAQKPKNETVASEKAGVSTRNDEKDIASPIAPAISMQVSTGNDQQVSKMKNVNNVRRRILEIKVYYDDNYCDTFVLQNKN